MTFGSPARGTGVDGQPAPTFTKFLVQQCSRTFPGFSTTIGSLRDVERGGSVSILLTVDLTEQVLADAIGAHASHVITYMPSPSQALSRIVQDDPVGRIVLKCAQAQVGVHALEGRTGGSSQITYVTEWLAESLNLTQAGNYFECNRASPLSQIITRLKALLSVRHLRLALGVVVDETNLAKALESCFVKTVALHIGEYGADQLSECSANVIIASEMQHKDVLAANARGVVVLLAGQSTIERAFMRHLRQRLQDEMTDSDWNVKVKCSQVDSNPLSFV